MIELDGSMGEGGGQILRSSLALSLITQEPFRIVCIRAGRSKPGLLKQHLTAVKAAVEISGASVVGATLGSQELSFSPGPVRPGNYRFDIGSAGSTGLVVQTILLPLALAGGGQIIVKGGTHNSASPPYEFLTRTFAPILARLGIPVQFHLERPGFYPAGGGEIRVDVGPANMLGNPIDLTSERLTDQASAEVLIARLPYGVAEQEISVLQQGLQTIGLHVTPQLRTIVDSKGPGNVILLTMQSTGGLSVVLSAFGEKGVLAEDVPKTLIAQAKQLMTVDSPIDEHLTDQLILPLALSGGGRFLSVAPSEHTRTNIDVLRQFISIPVDVIPKAQGTLIVLGN